MSEISNGGYVSISLKSVSLPTQADESVNVPGIYERLKEVEKTSKPLLIYNYLVENIPASPAYITIARLGDDFIASYAPRRYRITDEDAIVFYS